jgi:hypothetical protein
MPGNHEDPCKFRSSVDFRFIMFYHLKMTFSAGYAAAFEKHEKYTDELMFSLKIL